MVYVGFFINYILFPVLSYFLGKKISLSSNTKSWSVNKKQAITIVYFLVVFLAVCGLSSIFVNIQNQSGTDFLAAKVNYGAAFMIAIIYAYLFYNGLGYEAKTADNGKI